VYFEVKKFSVNKKILINLILQGTHPVQGFFTNQVIKEFESFSHLKTLVLETAIGDHFGPDQK